MGVNPYPALNERARGWLRFLWTKASTPDDWTEDGEPNPWWDGYSTPPTLSFPRFDLSESSYGVAVMADLTPAWREAYTRILDELVARHTTYWAAIDWLTQIGHDPRRKEYPQEWIDAYIPKHLIGEYDVPGWTANGVQPWGLQPDPIGADGMLFFKGFFNLLLCFYAYVAGDRKWHEPFGMAGLDRARFPWTHPAIAELMTEQWVEHPEGPHCENTKIWPYCLSAAGLGLQMYDNLYGSALHARVFPQWLDIARQSYWHIENDELQWFAAYYDPIIKYLHKTGPGGGLPVAMYILPQDRALGEYLYHAASRWIGWHDPSRKVGMPRDPRFVSLGLVLAHELGDRIVEARLWDVVEHLYEPRVFGDLRENFGWWFGFGEHWPRGQLSALLMLSEIGGEGAWWRLFNQPNLEKFDAPTVTDVDFPTLGIAQAWNDRESGMLQVSTYAATPSASGSPTTFRVANLPDSSAVHVRCDGQEYSRFRSIDGTTIELETTVEPHSFQIFTCWHGLARGLQQQESGSLSVSSVATPVRTVVSSLASGTVTSCPCCS